MKVQCPECQVEFITSSPRGQAVKCRGCGAEFEAKPVRPDRNAPPAETAQPRRAAKGGHHLAELIDEGREVKRSPVVLIAIIAVAVIGGAVAFFLMRGTEEKKKSDAVVTPTEKKTEAASRPAGPDDDIFTVKPPSATNATASQEDAASGEKRRVVGREPTTVKMEELTEHVGRLYVGAELAKEINDLKARVAENLQQRYDLPAEDRKTFDRLVLEVDKGRRDPFLSEADSELEKINNFLNRREVHRRDKSGELFPKPFMGFAIKPYVLFVQCAIEGNEEKIAKETASQLAQLQEDFIKEFGSFLKLDTSKKDKLIKVILLRSFEDYNHYNRVRDPERDKVNFAVAHYEPDTRRLVVPLDVGKFFAEIEDSEYGRRAVMFHEGTHQLIHTFSDHKHLSAYGSMWSDEGVAEFFGGHTIDAEGKYHFRKLNMARLPDLLRMQTRAERLTLREMIQWTRHRQAEAEQKEPREAMRRSIGVYALGWAFVEFLNNYKSGKYVDKYEAIMKDQFIRGDTGLATITKHFTDEEFETLENEFNDYVDEIIKAAKENRIYNGVINATTKSK